MSDAETEKMIVELLKDKNNKFTDQALLAQITSNITLSGINVPCRKHTRCGHPISDHINRISRGVEEVWKFTRGCPLEKKYDDQANLEVR